MMKRLLAVSVFVGLLLLPSGFTLAADQESPVGKVQTQEQEQIYGSQLMTQQERAEYRVQINAAKTARERERIRREHHRRMNERAKTQGVILPEAPADGKGGMGSGSGTNPDGGGMRPKGGGKGSRGGSGH